MTHQKNVESRPCIGAGSPQHDVDNTLVSRQVSWFETFKFAERLAASHDVGLNHLPLPGSPAWCGMADDDARKLMSMVLGGVREALTNDTHQTAMAEASQAISAAADWTAMARAQLRHARAVTSGAYIPRKAS
ncbi:DUF2742 domain-containing protein [Mycolicibacterium fortuitum]|jgi:hypothetical protein|uniref:DUF2742 domain-containing protein n=1 Tax=Mycolicibacterium fortuitum TaxID=1766 RepID=UPI003AAAFF51